MRYILYARKSSESEDRQVQSIDDQLKELRNLAAHRSLRIIEEMTESKSAKDPGVRPIFAQVLEKIQAGQADAILCWSVNRLSRNPVDSGTLSWMLQKGVLKAIQSIDREYRPEDNVLLMAVESGVANQYILDLRKNVARGTQSKIEKGWYPHRAPEGYRNNTSEKTIETDGERFVLLRRAWELMLTGAYTVPQVLEELNRWGYRTKKMSRSGGKGLSRTSLYDLFANPFYYGYFGRAGSLHRGAHQPMVTRLEFDRVQEILGKDHHIQPQKREFAFTGLIRCGACGCLITAEQRVKRYVTTGHSVNYTYYHCTGQKGCSKQSVSESYLEAEISHLLEQCTIHPVTAEWIIHVLERDCAEQPATSTTLYEQQSRSLVQLQRKLSGLVDMRADDEITRDEFLQRKAQIEAEIVRLQQAIDGIEATRRQNMESVRNALRYSATAYERFTRGNVRTKREVARSLGTNYVLTLGKLEIEPHPLLDRIRTFEPLENGSKSNKKDPSDPKSPSWLDMPDYIRRGYEAAIPFFPGFQV